MHSLPWTSAAVGFAEVVSRCADSPSRRSHKLLIVGYSVINLFGLVLVVTVCIWVTLTRLENRFGALHLHAGRTKTSFWVAVFFIDGIDFTVYGHLIIPTECFPLSELTENPLGSVWFSCKQQEHFTQMYKAQCLSGPQKTTIAMFFCTFFQNNHNDW